MVTTRALLLLFVIWVSCSTHAYAEDLRVLFLGDNGHHQPRIRFAQIQPVLAARGVRIDYTDNMHDLNTEFLQKHDALVVYANIDRIEPSQERALLDYVAGGGGFVPLHCATYCFRNSDDVVALMGGQFKRHGGEIFRTEIAASDHPIMAGFAGFESWDETYVHHLHNEKNRTVLSYRVDAEGREPWTWIRTHGKGRVFYTAWGHDHRTWSNPGFHNLVERGLRWAAGQSPNVVPAYQSDIAFVAPQMTAKRSDKKPLEYIDVGAKIPNYPPSRQWGVQKDPLTKMQKPLPPAESMKHFVTPEGFRVELYASEPELGGKPIAMNWDDRGRLWVCESYDYPNELQSGDTGRDRIRICEDTDQDGKADKFTVFAEKLSIPTAITFYRGGVIVQNGVETLYLKDTDGDDKSDVRKVLISNWALGDTHGGVSNFRYGHDNWFWAMQGYNNSAPVVNGAKQQSFRMGFFRFRLDAADPPNVTDLEFVRSTNNNTWGLGLTEDGLVTGSTANRNPSVYMPLANRYYEQVRGWSPSQLGTMADNHLFEPITDRVRQVDQHGGYTAGSGHAVYTARAYPREYWNRTAFVCGPTGHLVGTFVMRREGADMNSYSPANLLASTDEWSAPIAAEVGPDGNVWVLDWYNFIVQHNPTPRGFERGKGNAYETDLRDKKFGRIYRVVYEGNKDAQAWQSLGDASPAELVLALGHPTMTWRLHAQRLLVERGRQDVVSDLVNLLKTSANDSRSYAAVHALWTLNGLSVFNSNEARRDLAEVAFRSPIASVRRAALLTIPLNDFLIGRFFEGDRSLLLDVDYQVRLAALRALADMPEPSGLAFDALRAVAAQPAYRSDRWLKDALSSAAAVHGTIQARFVQLGESVEEELLSRLAEHAARSEPDAKSVESMLEGLSAISTAHAEAVIQGYSAGWSSDRNVTISPAGEDSLEKALTKLGASAKGELVRLASRFGSKRIESLSQEIAASLRNLVTSDEANDTQRIDAAVQLVGLRPKDETVIKDLLSLVGPRISPELAAGLVNAVAESSVDTVGIAVVADLGRYTPQAREAAINALLKRSTTTVALLSGIEGRQLQISDLKLDQRQSLSNHPDRDVKRRWNQLLAASGGLPDPDRQKVIEDLIPLTHQTGNVKRGFEVFKKQCSKCHVHGNEGQQIGPNLTGMSVHPKEELLVHILDPSRSVEGNFRQYTVITVDGQIINGMLAAESKTAVEIIDTEAKRHAISRDDIEALKGSTKSVMPEGFEKQLTKVEFSDLLEFLTDKGKFVPLPLDQVATAISTKGLFTNDSNGPDQIVFSDWGGKSFNGVPFQLVDPNGRTTPNIVLLHGPLGTLPPKMPKQVDLPANMPLSAIHMLSGVGGWSHPYTGDKSTSVTVRLTYANGEQENHELKNGIHFADYIRRVDVPGSEFAFQVRGQQVRYLKIKPKRAETIKSFSLIKGDDQTAPIVVAITLESR